MKSLDFNRHWGKIIDTMHDGLMLIAPDGAIRMVNRSFEHMTGYPAEKVVGRSCTLLNCDACETTLKEGEPWWCNLFERGEVIRRRCVVMKSDGTYLPVLKNASLIRDAGGKALGAVETLTDISELERLDQTIDHLSRQLDLDAGFHGIIGKSDIMRKVFQVIEKAAQSDAPVIIFGESGTGKELVAQAVHDLGRRREKPFVQLNCAALNEALLESELFGHVKGAFTGAYRHRIGRFEAAHEGDLFLDEIADVPFSIQVKLLRALETKQFERVGDHRPISVDVRIITATNKNLLEMIADKKFRDDLFFRINVIPIHIPPLRERVEDIPLLVNTFMERLRRRTGKPIDGLAPSVLNDFISYPWPGNVRELKSALEYAFVIAEKGAVQVEHIPSQILMSRSVSAENGSERETLIQALRSSKGNQTKAARILGVNRVTVWNRMRKYGIDPKRV
ncbi:MAG: PAS domain S-box protein [Desulfobacteraceae bacterium]|nr:MAG: PAS domain S-box protein [Desulfobacteraceae bacterium]